MILFYVDYDAEDTPMRIVCVADGAPLHRPRARGVAMRKLYACEDFPRFAFQGTPACVRTMAHAIELQGRCTGAAYPYDASVAR